MKNSLASILPEQGDVMEKQRSKQSSGATVGCYFKMLPAGPGTPWTALLGNSEQMPLQCAENWPEYLSIMGKKLQIRTVQYSVGGNLDGAISGGCRYRFLVVYLTPVRIAQWVGPVLETCKERRPAFVTQPYKGQSSIENSIHNPIPWRTLLKHLCKKDCPGVWQTLGSHGRNRRLRLEQWGGLTIQTACLPPSSLHFTFIHLLWYPLPVL